jgi:nucleoside-diphosphate-sugar epimerase
VLITGAQGFLGRYLTDAFLRSSGASVTGVGRSERLSVRFTHDLSWGGERVPAPLPPALSRVDGDGRYAYRRLDLTDVSSCARTIDEVAPTLVVHAAAALRDERWVDLVEANVVAVAALLEACAGRTQPPTVVLVSSGSVYGSVDAAFLPLREDGPFGRPTPYGATKRLGEVIGAADPGWPRPIVARVFNLIGPGLQDRHLPAVLAREFAAARRRLADPAVSVGSLDASRDFIDVRDAASAVALLSTLGDPGRVYNVASGIEVRMRTLFDAFARAAGVPVRIEGRPDIPDDASRTVADISRLRSVGFSRTIDLEQSVDAMLSYYDRLPAPPRRARP